MRVSVKAVLYSLRLDRDGETRLTLEIPMNQLPEAAKLCAAIHQVLQVTFVDLPSGVIGGRREGEG